MQDSEGFAVLWRNAQYTRNEVWVFGSLRA
jgi:hypothetical protein